MMSVWWYFGFFSPSPSDYPGLLSYEWIYRLYFWWCVSILIVPLFNFIGGYLTLEQSVGCPSYFHQKYQSYCYILKTKYLNRCLSSCYVLFIYFCANFIHVVLFNSNNFWIFSLFQYLKLISKYLLPLLGLWVFI